MGFTGFFFSASRSVEASEMPEGIGPWSPAEFYRVVYRVIEAWHGGANDFSPRARAPPPPLRRPSPTPVLFFFLSFATDRFSQTFRKVFHFFFFVLVSRLRRLVDSTLFNVCLKRT